MPRKERLPYIESPYFEREFPLTARIRIRLRVKQVSSDGTISFIYIYKWAHDMYTCPDDKYDPSCPVADYHIWGTNYTTGWMVEFNA